ncbi:MAG: hypothetical protein N2C14_32635, partial [Planctomycetales bacterium]
QHRWQQTDRPEDELAPLRGRRRWFQFKIGAFMLLLLVLMGLYVSNVLFWPDKTLMITAAVTNYSSPLPPNAWAAEDVEAFQELNARNLEVVDLSNRWKSGAVGMRYLRNQLGKIASRRRSNRLVIVWLSMHGAADDSGQPCLIPPEGSPTDPSTWIKVEDVLQLFKAPNVPADARKLLVFDCARMDVNWKVGLLYNDFSERLARAVNEANVKNLAVLNASGSGQKAYFSAELGGSVFGHYLKRALEGDADQESEQGNGDSYVSVAEAYRYTRHHTRQWVLSNRHDLQEPMLLPDSDAAEFALTWSVPDDAPAPQKAPDPSASAEDLDKLWTLCHGGSETNPEVRGRFYRFAPAALRDFEQKLLWLEKASVAGKDYGTASNNVKSELNRMAKRLRPSHLPDGLAAYNLPLAKRFNRLQASNEEIAKIRKAIFSAKDRDKLGAIPYPARIQAVWEELTDAARTDADRTLIRQTLDYAELPPAEYEPGFIEHHFLRMLNEHLDPDANFWPSDDLLLQALRSRNLAEKTAVPNDYRVHYWMRGDVELGDARRRLAEDLLFIGGREQNENAATAWNEAGFMYAAADKKRKAYAAALEVRDRAWAETPYLAQWLARPAPLNQSVQHDALLNDVLLPLLDAVDLLADCVEDSFQRPGETLDSVWKSRREVKAGPETKVALLAKWLGEDPSLSFEQFVEKTGSVLSEDLVKGVFNERCTSLLDSSTDNVATLREI